MKKLLLLLCVLVASAFAVEEPGKNPGEKLGVFKVNSVHVGGYLESPYGPTPRSTMYMADLTEIGSGQVISMSLGPIVDKAAQSRYAMALLAFQNGYSLNLLYTGITWSNVTWASLMDCYGLLSRMTISN